MKVSTRSLHGFGFLLFTAAAVGCAQPGVSDLALPTSPSTVSVAPSRSLQSSEIATLGPGASYDASGMWHFVDADVHGNDEETFDTIVSQDGNGDLSFVDPEGTPVTLERLGTGVIITYRVSLIGSEGGEGDCDIRIQGTARLDTRTNTMTAPIRLKELGCSNGRLGRVVTATKLN
jgi:hypothetical protein